MTSESVAAADLTGFRRQGGPLRVAILPGLVLVSALLGVLYGPSGLPASETVEIIIRWMGFSVGPVWPASDVAIVTSIRLPEVTSALLVGAALSLSGALFQAVLRNPLADPFVIGSSSGAAFGVAVAFVSSISFVWLGFGAVQLFSFVGSGVAVALVLLLSRSSRTSPVMTLLLAGFAVSTLMVAGMWLVAYEGGSTDRLFNWTMGNLEYVTWSQLEIVAPLAVVLMLVALAYVRDLNALLLGEDQARFLGLNTESAKLSLIVIGSLLTGLAVSIAGIIGFVGLVVPHVARLLYGPDHRLLLPASALLGGAYLALADLLARTLSAGGGEIPLGILTAFIGAPVFLLLLNRAGGGYSF